MRDDATAALREYGLPDSEIRGDSIPVAKSVPGMKTPCPNCGCAVLLEITVEIKQPLLRGGAGTGQYLGCPACPWASQMICVARPRKKENES